MLIHFRCPHCEKLLALGTHKGGARIDCPMCAHSIAVPPRTEVEVPATTVVILPDLAPEWWQEAPAAPESKSPSPPTPPAESEAWWLTADAPPPSESPP